MTDENQIATTDFDYELAKPEYRERLRFLAQEGRVHLRRTREEIIAFGEVLLEAKALLPHGQFRAWTASEFGIANSTISYAMKKAREADLELEQVEIENANIGILPKRTEKPERNMSIALQKLVETFFEKAGHQTQQDTLETLQIIIECIQADPQQSLALEPFGIDYSWVWSRRDKLGKDLFHIREEKGERWLDWLREHGISLETAEWFIKTSNAEWERDPGISLPSTQEMLEMVKSVLEHNGEWLDEEEEPDAGALAGHKRRIVEISKEASLHFW